MTGVLAAGTRLGPYEIVSPLGAGGMGEVYRARDTKLNRDVAIKILPEVFAHDSDRLARFQREAQVLASLNHPNIAHIHGLEDSGGVRALVMELVEGEDLSQRIARGPIPLDDALPIAKQIADALEAAHEQGIIHRDLKPANIKVRPDGTVKVLDFGLAKALDPMPASPHVSQSPTITSPAMTQVGVLLGTAAYMSPEQAAGKIVDKRTDVWALGVVLLEMLTGRPVFSGETVSHVLAAVLKSDPDWTTLPSNTPRSIRRLLRRSLEKDVKRRLHSAADARLEIEDAVAPSDAELSPIVPARRITRTAVTIATVIALLASVAAAMMAPAAFRHWRETPQASRPIWLEVRPSAGNALGFNRNAPESDISPDGEKLAYSAVAPDGIRHVWLQRFDRPTPQRIDGTEGGGNPFWAPDSRWLGFVSSDKLMKVDTATGTSQTICDAPAFAGATWNQDGEIVFSADAAEGSRLLFRVRAVGGTPRPVTTADGSHAHRSPQFLPDGHHLLFQVDAPNPAGGVFVMDVDDARTKKKIRASNMPAVYAPTGHILFSEGTTLFAQGFDPRRLETVGEPIPIANGVSTEPTYSVSPSGVLTFRPPVQTEMTELTWFTRQGQTERTIGPRAGYQTLALSPDQRQVAVEKTDARTSETDISLIDAARSITSRFTLTHDRHEFPVWSADGARLLYASHRNGTIGIFVKPVAGGAEQTISVDANHPLDWSPDGHYVLMGTKNNQNLVALSTTSGEQPIRVVDQGVQEAQFSPDGRWVVYSLTSFGREEVYVTAFPSSVQKRQISSSGGGQPRWPRLANEIIYLAPDGKLMSVPVKLGAEFEATTPVPLFAIRTNPGVNQRHQYAVSEDGQRFLVSALVDELGSQSTMTVVFKWPALLNK